VHVPTILLFRRLVFFVPNAKQNATVLLRVIYLNKIIVMQNAENVYGP
jgi:hypothetical protein